MPAAFTTLQLTDGTTTLDLVDGTNYQLQTGGWAPYVARRRRALVGGLGVYTDADEAITIDVYGATGAALHSNLAALSQMLDAADAWQDGSGAPVLLRCLPQGSTAAVWEAVVIGAPDADTVLTLPATYNDVLMAYTVAGVQLTIRHRPWLAPAETSTSSPGINSNVITLAFSTSAALPSPLGISMDGIFGSGTAGRATSTIVTSLLAVTGSVNQIAVMNAKDGVSSAPFTTVVDTSRASRSGTVARYTPPDTLFHALTVMPPSGFRTNSNRVVSVYATVRANTLTPQFQLRASGYDQNAVSAFSDKVTLDAVLVPKVLTPQMAYLGTFTLSAGLDTFQIEVACDTISSGLTLDIDAIALIALDDVTGRIIGITSTSVASIAPNDGDTFRLTNSGWETQRDARLRADDGSLARTITTTGRCDTVTTGTTVAVLWMGCGGDDPTMWRMVDSGGSMLGATFSATRRALALLPE
ncbi:MAG TPA: hypothetical protein VFT66_15620 [Roseiflexaceae bacterium]|nr:hypothetical protein [Roseiflexaceae bacterium]